MPRRFWILAATCAILPDADALGFFLGVPYGSTFGHRGFSHSLVFAGIIGLCVVELFFPNRGPRFTGTWWSLFLFYTLVTASHGLLDAMTNGGLGVATFSPFSNHRYFLPWRPVKVSPIGVTSFFNQRGLAVIVSELEWIWLPLTVLVIVVEMWRRATNDRSRPTP